MEEDAEQPSSHYEGFVSLGIVAVGLVGCLSLSTLSSFVARRFATSLPASVLDASERRSSAVSSLNVSVTSFFHPVVLI